MTNKNDERILKLKEEIDKKKETLGRQPRFSPITTCVLDLYGTKYNLNVADEETLALLSVLLNSLKMSIDDLGCSYEQIKIGGFSVLDWADDVKSKLYVIEWRKEKKKLDSLEKQLTKLLSDDKQTELAIDELASLI